ncbi:hypothetical protein N0V82_008188 [Gnomoniopsis sp. IMI 355080]|nr:hypothetical protein N0V82_008188 [Gnomoniopsis sp. IMI 355080]
MPTSSTSSNSQSATSSSNSGGLSGGDIAGTVVGSVCGLGIIAAVSAYFFWFRPRQQAMRRKEQDEARLTSDAANEAQDPKNSPYKPIEMMQQPPELPSPDMATELPNGISGIVEVPGGWKGGFELHPESHAVELPGDQDYRSSESIQSDR